MMQHPTYILLLLSLMICGFNGQKTIYERWMMQPSTNNLIGLFPEQQNQSARDNDWIVHSRAMFRAAVILSQQFNITFNGDYLGYQEISTSNDIMITIDHACQTVSNSNVVGLIGPAYSREARYIASFAYRLGIIGVSYSATSFDLSNIDHGGFFRVVPSDENIVSGLVVLFGKYKWKSCIIIYQNDDFGYGGMQSSRQKFSEAGIRVRATIKFDLEKEEFQDDFSLTLNTSASRIVIAWTNQNAIGIILKRAIDTKLMGKDFVWITTSPVPLSYFNQADKQKLIGVLTVEPFKADFLGDSINKTLLNAVSALWQQNEPETFPGDKNIHSFGLFTFDSTWALILSLQKLCSNHSSCLKVKNDSNCFYREFQHWQNYNAIMRDISFHGVSGDVKFSNTTIDRAGDLYYLMKNIRPLKTQSETIIDYAPVFRWKVGSPEWNRYGDDSDNVVWPDQSENIPSDHQRMQGVLLRVITIESPPFIILKNASRFYQDATRPYEIIQLTDFDGIYKDIIVNLKNRMGFILSVALAKPSAKYDELVRSVANGSFDTVLTGVTITAERRRLVDFSRTILPSSIRLVVRKPKSTPTNMFFFLKPFSLQLWLLIIALMPYTSVLLWFFERTTPDKNEKNSDHKAYSVRQIFNDIVSILVRGDSTLTVLSNSGRFLIFSLYLVRIILFTVYTASLLSFMIIENAEPSISGVDDIKNGKIPSNRLGIIKNSSIENYYLNSISNRQDYYELDSIAHVYTSVQSGEVDAALWGNHSIIYHINNHYCDLMTVGIEVGLSSYEFPVRKDWLYREELDDNILSLLESPEFDTIKRKWFKSSKCGKSSGPVTKRSSISLVTASGVFIVYAICSGIALANHCRQIMAKLLRKYIV